MKRACARDLLKVAAAAAIVAGTGGCGMITRLSEVGDYPQISPITNPQAQPGYRPVNLPMPAPMPAEDNPNSLWRPGARAFFKDIRAKEVGDTVTVRLKLDDSAKMSNKTKRKRDDNEKMGVQALLGYEAQLGKILPRDYNSADCSASGRSTTPMAKAI